MNDWITRVFIRLTGFLHFFIIFSLFISIFVALETMRPELIFVILGVFLVYVITIGTTTILISSYRVLERIEKLLEEQNISRKVSNSSASPVSRQTSDAANKFKYTEAEKAASPFKLWKP